jgi:hypothetical protein
MKIGAVEVCVQGGLISWSSGLAVDADGSPRAYAPMGGALRGLDYLANAGKPGSWWGLACDDDGQPFVQHHDDPCPGYYVSTTALIDRGYQKRDPRRYVNSDTVPFLAVPPELLAAGVRKGDLAVVSYGKLQCGAIVADVGPRGHIGEGSIALAKALGINADPRRGGVESGVGFVIYLGSASSPAWPRSNVAQLGVELARVRSVG